MVKVRINFINLINKIAKIKEDFILNTAPYLHWLGSPLHYRVPKGAAITFQIKSGTYSLTTILN